MYSPLAWGPVLARETRQACRPLLADARSRSWRAGSHRHETMVRGEAKSVCWTRRGTRHAGGARRLQGLAYDLLCMYNQACNAEQSSPSSSRDGREKGVMTWVKAESPARCELPACGEALDKPPHRTHYGGAAAKAVLVGGPRVVRHCIRSRLACRPCSAEYMHALDRTRHQAVIGTGSCLARGTVGSVLLRAFKVIIAQSQR